VEWVPGGDERTVRVGEKDAPSSGAGDANAPFVEIWGTGTASREFLYVDDAANAIVLAAGKYDGAEPVNLGVGSEITIRQLVLLVAKLSGYQGEIRWDASKPDGQPRRALDTSRARDLFGFRASTTFEQGLRETVNWYLQTRSAQLAAADSRG
jgi:GDP-L-fucose synthase